MSVTTQLTNPELANIVYKVRKVLEALTKSTVWYKNSYHEAIPAMEGTTARLWRISEATPNYSPATPGAPIVARTFEDSTVDIATESYTDAIALANVLSKQAHIKVESASMEQIKQLAEYVVESVIRSAVDSTCTVANVNLFAANNVAAVGSLVATDVATAQDFRKLWARLDASGVKKFSNGGYKLILHSAQLFTATNDSTAAGFLDLNKYTSEGLKNINKERVDEKGFAGNFAGFDIYSTPLQTTGLDGAGSIKVFYGAAFGDASVGCVDLSLDKVFELIEIDGKHTGDPTMEVAKTIAYRMTMGAKVLSEDSATASKQRVLRLASAGGTNSIF